MVLHMSLGENSYDIVVENGALKNVGQELSLQRKVLILTDDGVPCEYSEAVKNASLYPYVYTIKQGEQSKNAENYLSILKYMAESSFTRSDCVVAVGGGVCGDLAGFVASSYMRGIDFYNVPTTLLSQLDSSIGGKVAIDLGGIKNIVGAFYQPKKVIIDPQTLKTLDKRQLSAGLCEGIKMAMTSSYELFELIEGSSNLEKDLEKIILGGLKIKKAVVEEDPKEKGLRRVLNFGHTIGHAVESREALGTLLHGECVAIGMLPMTSPSIRARLKGVLEKYSLPTEIKTDKKELIDFIKRDKKAKGDLITIVLVKKIGTFEMKEIKISELENIIDGGILE